MSEITNSATIKVSVDGSGVESGLAKIDAAAAKTGKTLDTLGGSDGMKKVGDAAEAAARRAEAAGRALAGTIQRTTTALEAGGKSTSAYYEAIANQRGIDPSVIAPYLSQLRLAEIAQRQVAAAIEETNQAAIRSAQAAKVEAAAQREATQALAGRESFLNSLREQVQLYGRSSDEVLRFRAAQAGVAESAAPLILQLQNVRAAHEQIAAAARSEAEAQKKAVQVQAGRDSFITSLEQQAFAIGKTRSQLLELQAAQLGVSTQAAPFITKLREAEASVKGIGISAGQTAAALRGVPAQFTDIVVSLQAGQSPLTVLLQQGGQLKDMFGGAGNAAKAMGGYIGGLINPITVTAAAVGVLAIAYSQGAAEAKEFNKQLILTNNAAGASASSSAEAARSISTVIGTQGAAAEAVAALLSTGRVAAADLARFGETAIRAQRELGISVADTAKQFADLKNEPVKALKELNDNYHFLTAATYEQVKALRDQGREVDAGLAAQEAFASGLDTVTKRVEANVGLIESAWRGISGAAKSAWDQMLGIGREDSLETKLASVRDKIFKGRVKPGSFIESFAFAGERVDLKNNEAEEVRLVALLDLDKKRNAEAAASVQLQADKIKLSDLLDTYLDKEGKKKKEIAVLDAAERAAKVGDNQRELERIAKARIAIEEKYKEKSQARTQGKKPVDDFANLLNKINGKDLGLDSDFSKNIETLSAAFASGRITMGDYISTMGAYVGQQKFATDADKERAKALEIVQKAISERDSEDAARLANIDKEVAANQALASTFGLSKQAIELETIARLENDLANRQANEYDEKKVASLEREIAARKANVSALGSIDTSEAVKKAGEDLDKFLDPSKAQEFGDALRGAFGQAGESLVKLTNSLQSYGAKQAEIEKQRGNAALKLINGGSEKKYLEEIAALNKQSTKDKLGSYGDMTAAAAGFFDEQSKGYKALQAASQVFHAAELALTIAGLLPKAQAAVLTQGEGDPYTAFGRMAAMAALVAGIGVAVSGSGATGGASAADVQKKQGAGSVLGDSSSKSDSIARALENIKSNTFQGLVYSAGMLTALQGIQASVGGLASLVVRNGGIVNGENFGITTGKLANGSAPGLNIATSLGKAVGGPLAGLIGSIGDKLNGFFGKTTRTIVDSGLSFGGSLGGLKNGTGFNQYASVDTTKSSFFGLVKKTSNSIQSSALDADLSRQFSLIFSGLEEALKSAAVGMGVGADTVSAALNSLVLKTTTISLKGLKGDDLTEALNSVISKAMDEISAAAFPGFETFAKLGEGLAETVLRVANDFVAVDTVFASFGKTFGQIGLESIAARERLIDLAGGLDEFTKKGEFFLSNFFSEAEQANSLKQRIAPTLSQFGLTTDGPDAKKLFRDVVIALDTTTEAGARAYTTLIGIAPAFDEIVKAADGVMDERKGLQEQLNQLTLTQAQLLAKQRDALDESNRALFDNIQAITETANAIQSIKDAAGTLLGGVDSSLSALQASVNAEKEAENKAKALRIKAVEDVIDIETAALSKYKSLSDALRSTFDQIATPGGARGDRASAQAQIQTALAIARAGGGLPSSEGLRGALSTLSKDSSSLFSNLVDFQLDAARTRGALGDLADLTDGQISIEQKTLDALTAQKAEIERASSAEIGRLDDIAISAKKQVDALKGIDSSVLSVVDALAALAKSLSLAAANPVVAATPSIDQAYKDYLGRAPDAQGLDFFKSQAAAGVSVEDIVKAISTSPEAKAQGLYKELLGRAGDASGIQFWTKMLSGTVSLEEARAAFMQSDEYKKLHPLAVGTNNVPRDRIALIHEGERVIPSADNRELMARLRSPNNGMEILVAEVRRLQGAIADLQAANSAENVTIARNTGKSSNSLDRLMPEGDTLHVKVIT